MSLFSKILLSIIALVVVYALWPRDASLDRWDPQAMAESEVTAWKALRQGNTMKTAWNFYRIYDFEYRVSPVTALSMAQTKASAINSLLRSPDPADQEQMIPRFVEINTRLRGEVAQEFDPAVAGRSEYAVWVGVSEDNPAEALTNLTKSHLASLFSKPAAAVQKAAELRAQALHEAFSDPFETVDWDKVTADLASSWSALHALVASPAAPATE
jgi:hypothetical protein